MGKVILVWMGVFLAKWIILGFAQGGFSAGQLGWDLFSGFVIGLLWGFFTRPSKKNMATEQPPTTLPPANITDFTTDRPSSLPGYSASSDSGDALSKTSKK
ncbi:MAG: hypothetical protein M9936_32160 [Caldilinea sp.]|nr:hypothetical protein [Caldilinea sp.]MCB9116350.1 hypothetical protein [Caldilineaceae bacterium]MCB9121960.1 hypothetical protein [Caldilineaceae bacterium]MCO5214379.1 hypothetical protein [Caldilinea sp.]MCW5845148.1 hypothetical protein [Caldilinea sp.]